MDPSGNLVAGRLGPGSVLAQGFSIKTGFQGEASMLFSNGTVATIEPNTHIKITSFLQKPFDAGNRSISDLKEEPSTSQLTINLDSGNLVVQTKNWIAHHLSPSIHQPALQAFVELEFQLGLNAGGAKLDVSSSVVEFTPIGGQPIAISQGKGLDISPTGTAIPRPINPVVSTNINSKKFCCV